MGILRAGVARPSDENSAGRLMAGGHGGARRGAGRPLGRKNLRPGTSAALIEAARINENLIPVKFEGDSLEFLRAAMSGKIWPTREQLFAARSVLPIEHPPATSVDGRSVDEIREEVRREIFEEQRRDGEAAGKQLEHEIRRRREVIVEHRDAQLRAWIDAGELTQRAAELVRSLWAEQGDRPFHIDDFAMPDGGRADHITRISEIVPPPQPAPIRK
jgi:hypothetical protein